jgi:hypothetical protein
VHQLVLTVELVELATGLWCRPCALSTGVQATVLVSGAVPASLSTARRCIECDGDDLEPVGRDTPGSTTT